MIGVRGVGQRRSTSRAAQLAALFAGGAEGAWYDPSDFSTLFQDVGATTPVTAVGQAVFRVNDKSGRGHYLTQGTATKQPILRQDSQGKYYLEFDGVNDSLNTLTSGTINLSASDKVFAAAGYKLDSNAAIAVLLEFGAAATTAGGFGFITPRTAGVSNIGFNLTGTAQGQRAATIDTVSKWVASCTFDIAQATLANEIAGRLNGAVPSLSSAVAGPAGTGNLGNLTLYVGQRNDASVPLPGRWFGSVILAGLPTTEQIDTIENYLNSKTGAF